MKKRLLALFLLVALLLGGCGGEYKSSAPGSMAAPSQDYNASESTSGGLNFSPSKENYDYAETPVSPEAGGEVTEYTAAVTEKLIYRAELTLETVAFDEAAAALGSLAAQLGGFIEASNVSGYTNRYPDGTTRVVNRTASYTLRVPSSRFQEAVDQTGALGSVTNSNTNVENITSQFIDQDARKHSLEVQEERLLAMLEKAEDVYVLVELESRLADVRYEIEAIERQLRNWQQQVDYSTVQVYLREVAAYTPTASVQRSFGEKMADALRDGWSGFVYGLQDLALWAAECLPVLVVLGVVVVGVTVGCRKWLKKRKKAKAKQAVQPPEDHPEEK